jgi:hypothetical protein
MAHQGTSPLVQDQDLSPVYAATYNHLGIILWGPEKLNSVLEQEITWLERHPGFRIGWDHEVYTYDHLAEHAPETLDRMKAALARFQGRLGVGSCTYGQPLSAFINEESNIRQLTLAMGTVEKQLDYPISIYLMSEHAFHAQMPQLLVGCGFKGAILRTHFMMYGHNPEFEAPVGWWVGVDGSRIPTLPTYPGQLVSPVIYDRIPGLTGTLDNRIMTDAPSDYAPITLADFRRQFGERIQPLIATRADDARAREALIKAHEDDSDYVWILIEDVFKLLPQPRAEFRTRVDDFKVRMPWGYCGNWIWNRCRQAEARVLTAERLAAISYVLGGPAYEGELEKSWKNLLIAQHHDIQICGLEEDARRFLGECFQQTDVIIKDAMQVIAPRIGTGRNRQVLFNPLPWERTEWVPTENSGQVVSVPGLGFTTIREHEIQTENDEPAFQWQPEGQPDSLRIPLNIEPEAGLPTPWKYETAGVLLTPFYEACTAPTGGFRLVRNRQTSQILLSLPKTSGVLAGMINGMECESVGKIIEAQLEHHRAVLIEKGKIGNIPYRSEWMFYRHNPRIDWHGEFLFGRQWIGRPKSPLFEQDYQFTQGGQDPLSQIVPAFNDHEYKLRLRFYPYCGPHVVGIRDLPFHIAETDHPYVQGNYWTAVSDGQVGIALFNRGQMGSVRESDGAFSSILAFSLPYIWGTRVLEGKYIYDLGILPFTGPWQAVDLHRKAMEYNFPIQSCRISEEKDTLDNSWTPYKEINHGKVMLSALYVKAGKPYARFYEYGGGQAEVALEWMCNPIRLTAVNLRECEQGRLGRRLKLGPWQVQTVCFEAR